MNIKCSYSKGWSDSEDLHKNVCVGKLFYTFLNYVFLNSSKSCSSPCHRQYLIRIQWGHDSFAAESFLWVISVTHIHHPWDAGPMAYCLGEGSSHTTELWRGILTSDYFVEINCFKLLHSATSAHFFFWVFHVVDTESQLLLRWQCTSF